MLPTEAFAEVVAFLRLFDLHALAVTNALCSALAIQASTKIRWEEFPGLIFQVGALWIEVYRRMDASRDSFRNQRVAFLAFSEETAMAGFIAAALPNCIVEALDISWTARHILHAIRQVADSVVVKGSLRTPYNISHDESLGLAREFRNAKILKLDREAGEDEIQEIANSYRGSGIQELQYFRSMDHSGPHKFAFF